MKYDELDAAIVRAIERGARRFFAIAVCVEALAKTHALPRSGPDRVVDRRLQALRKTGRIVYAYGKWSVTP